MAIELAEAYLSLIPSLRGASASIEKQLGNINTTRAGNKLGGGLSQSVSSSFSLDALGAKLESFGSSITSVGNRLNGSITKPALLATTAVAGIFAATGWSRLTSIDSARQKLLGLGNSAEDVQVIMDNALASVKGTAYGFGEAASVAAAAVASGIQPGEELTDVLKTVADTAAIAGMDFSEAGNIFNSVMAKGKLQGDDMLQLTSRGVPVLKALSEELGVTQEEVSALVSKGQIDFKTFNNAMKKYLGGSALEMGNSMVGALANVKAAIGRVGAAFLDAGGEGGGFFSQIKPLLAEFTGHLDKVTEGAEVFGKKFGEAFGAVVDGLKIIAPLFKPLHFAFETTDSVVSTTRMKIIGFFNDVREKIIEANGYLAPFGLSVGDVALGFGAIALAAGPVLKVLGPIVSLIGKVLPLFGTVAGPIALAVGAFAALTAVTPELQNSLLGMAGVLEGEFKAAFSKISDAVAPLVPAFQDMVAKIGPAVAQIVDAVVPVAQTIIRVVSDIIAALAPAAEAIMDLFGELMPVIAPVIESIAGSLVPVLEQLGAFVVDVITNVIVPAIQGLADIISGVLNALIPLVEPIINTVLAVIQTFLAVLSGDWDAAWEGIKSAFSNQWQAIQAIPGAVMGVITSVISGAGTFITGLWNGLWNWVSSITGTTWGDVKRAVSTGIDGMIGFIRNIPSTIQGFFSNAGSILINAGSNIISGLLSGLRRGFEDVKNFVGGIGSWIAENKGPKAYDLALLVPAGNWIMDGLKDGLVQGVPALKRTLQDISSEIENYPASVFSAGTPAVSMSAFGHTPYAPHEIDSFQPNMIDARQVAREIALALNGTHVRLDGKETVGVLVVPMSQALQEEYGRRLR